MRSVEGIAEIDDMPLPPGKTPAGKRSDFFRADFLYAGWNSAPRGLGTCSPLTYVDAGVGNIRREPLIRNIASMSRRALTFYKAKPLAMPQGLNL